MAPTRRAVLSATALGYSRVLGANGAVRIAGLGTGGRCRYLLGLARKQDARIAAVCDVYEPSRAAARQLAPDADEYVEYRQALDRKDIDAVVIGSPDHWHVPMTIDAVRAGKDVYVEKPVSHTIEEGEQLLKVMAGSRQIVQVGYQQRSWKHFQAGREIVASGQLGRVTLILVSWYQAHTAAVPGGIEPSKLEWKRFLGSAPDQPFHPLRFRRWRWFWDFGGGHLTDLYSHFGDVVHWYMGEDRPVRAAALGIPSPIPEFECPATITASLEYPGGFEVTYHGSLIGSLDGGNLIFRGDKALMKLNRDGLAVYPEGVVRRELTSYPPPTVEMRSEGDGTIPHMANFLACVRSRKQPNSDAATAVAAARAAHIGNRALRAGTVIRL